MALIRCPECEKEGISDTASACPNCGYQIAKNVKKQKVLAVVDEKSRKITGIDKRIFITAGIVLVLAILGVLMTQSSKDGHFRNVQWGMTMDEVKAMEAKSDGEFSENLSVNDQISYRFEKSEYHDGLTRVDYFFDKNGRLKGGAYLIPFGKEDMIAYYNLLDKVIQDYGDYDENDVYEYKWLTQKSNIKLTLLNNYSAYLYFELPQK
jgi:hypothetical protein